MKRYQRKSPLKCAEIKVSRPLNVSKSKFVALLICKNKKGCARAPFLKINNIYICCTHQCETVRFDMQPCLVVLILHPPLYSFSCSKSHICLSRKRVTCAALFIVANLKATNFDFDTFKGRLS